MPTTMTMASDTINDNHHPAVITLEISSTTELASAQQRMSVLVISHVRLRRGEEHERHAPNQKELNTGILTEIDNRQAISFPICGCNSGNETLQLVNHQSSSKSTPSPETWMRIIDALHRGKNRIVLREWKQGACWWNLNMNQGTRSLIGNGVEDKCPRNSPCGTNHHSLRSPHTQSSGTATSTAPAYSKFNSALSMARAEVSGYRLAKLAIDHQCDISECIRNAGCEEGMSLRKKDQRMYAPEVLYFSHDTRLCQHNMDNQCDIEHNSPWALLSYFDNEDSSKLNKHQKQLCVEVDCESLGFDINWNISSSFCNGTMHSAMRNCKSTCPCYHFPTTMTKIRREFGFEEPHPRHGRVPTDECLEYAMMILNDVVVPIQSYFFMMETSNKDSFDSQWLFENLRSIGFVDCKQPIQTVKPFQYHDMIEVYRDALNRLVNVNALRKEDGGNDEKMDFMIRLLDKCVEALGYTWTAGTPPPLPPVLCHMDLQPQNLFFRHSSKKSDAVINEHGGQHKNKQYHSAEDCSVASIMDWEEACYADPRFELLLICRKVLASREQAEQLWQSYSNRIRHMSQCIFSKRMKNAHWDVGSLEPWLKLETVHSLCTLLLQAMDLLGGGRNPWESTSDLWGKIDRERRRLVQMGWSFCDAS